MRSVIIGFAALVLVGCGGEGKPKPAESTAVVPPPGPTPAKGPQAVTGKTWDVKMYGDQTGSRYDPASLTIKAGDAVRFTLINGAPHNVAFWPDSIPPGSASTLEGNMPEPMSTLTGPILLNANQTYTISFGGVPAGSYKYYCVPHLAVGMKGVIVVQ